jgi:hypothetical protein
MLLTAPVPGRAVHHHGNARLPPVAFWLIPPISRRGYENERFLKRKDPGKQPPGTFSITLPPKKTK